LILTKHGEVRKIKGTKGKLIKRNKRGLATFCNKKVASPLFCFNGVNPTLPSFRRVLSVLLRSAGNNIPDSADSG